MDLLMKGLEVLPRISVNARLSRLTLRDRIVGTSRNSNREPRFSPYAPVSAMARTPLRPRSYGTPENVQRGCTIGPRFAAISSKTGPGFKKKGPRDEWRARSGEGGNGTG